MDYSVRPTNDECFDIHRIYVAKVPDGNILDRLSNQALSIRDFASSIPAEQFEVVHAPYGWSVREVLEHCVDAERVFGYRTLRFATGDKTDLPGWDENAYVASAYGRNCAVSDLVEEFVALGRANLMLLGRIEPEFWNSLGKADGRLMSVRTLAWLMAGHWIHHEGILRTRLGMKASH